MSQEIEKLGVVKFAAEARVSIADMKEWPVARINQLFRGIAMAQKAIEGIPDNGQGEF